LKVSFFGPFYGSYVVFEIDEANYQYSLVSGPDKSYLWILSRSPTMPQEVKAKLVDRANALGFDTSKLIFVEHGNVEPVNPPSRGRREGDDAIGNAAALRTL
jgi:apolipoprotein D and lipocalin family protein